MTYAIPTGASWCFETRPLNADELREQRQQQLRAERIQAARLPFRIVNNRPLWRWQQQRAS